MMLVIGSGMSLRASPVRSLKDASRAGIDMLTAQVS